MKPRFANNWYSEVPTQQLRQEVQAVYEKLDELDRREVDPTLLMPRGVIVMWSGGTDEVPTGWALCDGSNGTPDLRDRFIIGAGGTLDPDDTGGSVSKSTSSDGAHAHSASTSSAGSHSHSASTGSAGAHSHTITVGSRTLSTSHMPSHTHGMAYKNAPGGQGFHWVGPNPSGRSGTMQTDAAGSGTSHNHSGSSNSTGAHTHSVSVTSGGAHTHSVTVNSAGDHSHSISDARPPFYALAFIMKL